MKQLASAVIDSFKSSPIMLGVLVLNVIMIGAGVYFLIRFGEVNAARFNLILERCLPKP